MGTSDNTGKTQDDRMMEIGDDRTMKTGDDKTTRSTITIAPRTRMRGRPHNKTMGGAPWNGTDAPRTTH